MLKQTLTPPQSMNTRGAHVLSHAFTTSSGVNQSNGPTVLARAEDSGGLYGASPNAKWLPSCAHIQTKQGPHRLCIYASADRTNFEIVAISRSDCL